MSKKSEVKTRKAQLIHTFGPGAMQVNKAGVSMITCGLDYWYADLITKAPLNKMAKFDLSDKRLENKLGVSRFRIPPDGKTIENTNVFDSPLPANRFPCWNICSNTSCQKMRKTSPVDENECRCLSCNAPMYQSRFMCICPDGHMQDFPWFEWLNFHNKSNCGELTCQLKLVGTGSTSSADIKVQCVTHKSRPVRLAGIFQMKKDNGEIVSSTIFEKNIQCNGHSPWLGDSFKPCEKPLVAALRQATNVYFAKTDTSILIPVGGDDRDKLIEVEYENIAVNIREMIEAAGDASLKVAYMTGALDGRFSNEELESFLKKRDEKDKESFSESEVEYRFQEYKYLLKDNNDSVLVTKPLSLQTFEGWFRNFFTSVSQIKELTVTNAFYGFDRIQPRNNRSINDYKKALRENYGGDSDWLPAVKVYGEGIFIEFNAERIKKWSKLFGKTSTFKLLVEKKKASPLFDSIDELSPEFLLIHTFAHLLINQLIFDCGYSTASLKERLYVSNSSDAKMCGVLIYTAAGDSEGSLGGLVRMAQQGVLEPIIRKAIESSNWCSSDPICREIGDQGGQGPGGMNLAACHNCALLPETSCEVFNSLLDRGTITSSDLCGDGYFDDLLGE